MICSVCYGMLRGHEGSEWRGTYDLIFNHHIDRGHLVKSANESCVICKSLLTELSQFEQKNQRAVVETTSNRWFDFYTTVRKIFFAEWLRTKKRSEPEERSNFISAYLSEIYKRDHPEIYRLDFKLEDKKRLGTFVLQRVDAHVDDHEKGGSCVSSSIEDPSTSALHTPFSSNTSSGEVLSLARNWIAKCAEGHTACPHKLNFDDWYPSRLIDLGKADEKNERTKSDRVRLISTRGEDQDPDNPGIFQKGYKIKNQFYVTLSHCWGKAKFTTLTKDNLNEFMQDGIKIADLPRTFRDAIYFARRLSKQVRYLWIDSLCIIQGKSEIQYKDWLRESASMYKIYRNAYCNISATAATDSGKGLFFSREPRELWEDDINLNVEGIPDKSRPWQQELRNNLFDTPETTGEQRRSLNVGHAETEKQRIERCRILDVSFWERHVDNAPVNRRGWVLQERMMAPRVLHFCQDQIAWECRQLEASESARSGLPIFRVKAGDIVRGSKLKSLIPHNDTLHNLPPQIHPYQCWKRVVEVYSRTQLTNLEDKLIALSGIASMMYEQTNDEYLAGMWRKYLESQLLWYVDPFFDDGKFYYESKRVESYRAPSFSWAAIEAPYGVKCGEVTDEGLHIEVIDVKVKPKSQDNRFGLVEEPSHNVLNILKLRGIVKQVELKIPKDPNGVIRYEWKLAKTIKPEVTTHRNVYLDSPKSDTGLLGPHAHMYCLPARKDSAGYLICLLLQLEKIDGRETGRFRRVGLTKIPNYEEGQEMVLEPSLEDAHVPYGHWNAQRKKHTIEIV